MSPEQSAPKPEQQPITKAELEEFCYKVKDNFRRTYQPGHGGHYDKADMLEDLTAFLKARGVEVEGC